jgi:DNA-binding response OmpR family regulator
MSNKRILVIDSDTPSREWWRHQFSRRGWSVALAATVVEARARLDPPPHCILLELALGDAAGETVLRQVADDNLPTRVGAQLLGSRLTRWVSVPLPFT